MRDYAAIATQYARDVVEGKILTGQLVRAACQRHLDDLERGVFMFDASRAARVCSFIEACPHVKGEWAKRRELIKLEPWQVFGWASVFGWVRADGTRRFRRVYWEVPRKNAKSTMASSVGLYCASADGEEGAEVYCGATTEQQAWEVFRPAKQMVERTAAMREALGLEAFAASIRQDRTGSRMEPIIGKPGDGASPSCAIVDEYHEHADSTLYDTMQTGMGARRQPLLIVITTAGVDLAGPCYAEHLAARKVLEGAEQDDELFALIYTLDDSEDWTTEAALWKANPNAGVSVSIDYLRSSQREAVRNSSKAGTFRTKHLNQWVTARSPYFNLERWKAAPRCSLSELSDCEAIVFHDLASKKDLAARLLVAKRDDGTYAVVPKFWLPEDLVDEARHGKYREWRDAGWLATTPGNIIDFAAIEDDLREVRESVGRLVEVAYDPFQATQFATRMQADGFPMVEYGATVKNFSEPMKATDALILAGKIAHDGNEVMTWCMSNVVARTDAKDNVFPRKEKPENKIDGAVALIGAIGRWLAQVEEEQAAAFVRL